MKIKPASQDDNNDNDIVHIVLRRKDATLEETEEDRIEFSDQAVPADEEEENNFPGDDLIKEFVADNPPRVRDIFPGEEFIHKAFAKGAKITDDISNATANLAVTETVLEIKAAVVGKTLEIGATIADRRNWEAIAGPLALFSSAAKNAAQELQYGAQQNLERAGFFAVIASAEQKIADATKPTENDQTMARDPSLTSYGLYM